MVHEKQEKKKIDLLLGKKHLCSNVSGIYELSILYPLAMARGSVWSS